MNNNVNKKLYSDVEQVELKEVSVELGLVDDIAKMTATANQISKQLGDAVNTADKLKVELEKQIAIIKKAYPVASKFQDQEDKIWEKAKKNAEDLGLQRKDIKGWAEFEKAGLDVNSAINGANNYMS